METREDGNLRLVKLGPLGPFANNAYVIADTASKEAVLVDMPAESEQALAVIRDEGYRVKAILATHSHGDHWGHRWKSWTRVRMSSAGAAIVVVRTTV